MALVSHAERSAGARAMGACSLLRLTENMLRTELPAELMLNGEPEQEFEVPSGGSRQAAWDLVLGRQQGIALMENPPRVWFESGDRRLEATYGKVWIRRWEKRPPLVTNLAPGEVRVTTQDSTGTAPGVRCEFAWPEVFEARDANPFGATLHLPASAVQPPEVHRVPVTAVVGGRRFPAGHKLVEAEYRRVWASAHPKPIAGALAPERTMPTKPMDPTRENLWTLDWNPHVRDTLVDVPVDHQGNAFLYTNVRFPAAARIRLRQRGQGKLAAWLQGVRLATGSESGTTEEMMVQPDIDVPGGTWLPSLGWLPGTTC
jgi:hypothetical protein